MSINKFGSINLPGEIIVGILDGSITQVRVPLKHQPLTLPLQGDRLWINGGSHSRYIPFIPSVYEHGNKNPFKSKTNLIFVREKFLPDPDADDDAWDDNIVSYVQWAGCGELLSEIPPELKNPDNVLYSAGYKYAADHVWKRAVSMPPWASRIWLNHDESFIERIQDIKSEDVEKMGFVSTTGIKQYWNTHYNHGWNTNDWVWVLNFSKAERPEL